MRPLDYYTAKTEEVVKGTERSSRPLAAAFVFAISCLRWLLPVLPATDVSCAHPHAHEAYRPDCRGLITGRAGSAFDSAQDNLSADIGLLTVIVVDTEVFGIIEGPFVIPVRKAVGPNFFRDRSRILTQELGNIFKRCAFVQFVFDIDTVFKGKVFLVARNIFTHHMPPSTAVRREDNHTMNI